MAKQNVSFAERHLEKFVAGVAGLVLLGVLVYYGFMGPNAVTVNGEAVGPKDFYDKLGEQAVLAQGSLKNKSAPKVQEAPHLVTRGAKGVHEGVKLPLDYMASAFPPNPAVPMVTGSDTQGDQVLATVLPPKALNVTSGSAYLAMPPMEAVRVGPPQGASGFNPDAPAIPVDYHFVVISAGLDRKAQADLFRAAKYDETRCQLIVAAVQAERRELGPDGKWSEPMLILSGREAYTPRAYVAETRIKSSLVDGHPTFTDPELAYVGEYRHMLYSPDAQNEILRPPFQPLMEQKWQLAWQPPKTLPGFEFKLADFGVAFPAEGGKPLPGPRQPTPGPGGMGPNQPQPQAGPSPLLDLAAQKRARQRLADARAAAKAGKWQKFSELIQELTTDQSTPEKERKAADDLQQEYDADLKKWQAEEDAKRKLRESLGIVDLGQDQEPLWMTDIKVQPGKTYQYRLRVVAYNDFAGMFSSVKDLADAEKLVIDGQWSDWSEPITVAPTVQMFFTDVLGEKGSGQKARVTVSAWVRGEWKEARSDVELGEPIDCTSGRDKLTYDGVITGLDDADASGREYRPRNPRGGYEPPVKTGVLTLVSAAGQVEEHLQREDSERLRAHRDRVKKEKDLLATPIESPTGSGSYAPGGYTPQTPMGPGRGMMPDPRFGGRGGRGGYDPRMGPGGPGGRFGRPGGRGDPRFNDEGG